MFDNLSALPPENRWRRQAYPWPIVAALIEANHVSPPEGDTVERRYLLIRRRKEPYGGFWALVGGKWDFGETLAAAAVREVLEETGLQTHFVALRGVVNERLAPGTTAGEAAHFLIFVCEVVATAGQASEQDEGEVAWFSLAQIDRLQQNGQIIPTDYTMIRRFAGSSEAVIHYEAEMAPGMAPGVPPGMPPGTPPGMPPGPVLIRFEAVGRDTKT
jgi:8-oxo-dGTP diphosphatase